MEKNWDEDIHSWNCYRANINHIPLVSISKHVYLINFSSKNSWAHFLRILQRTLLLQNFLHMNSFMLLILLTWFGLIKSWICFVFPNSGTGILRIISDCYYYSLVILFLTQGLLIVLSSIIMISGLFLKREIFILCILT